MSRVFKLVFAAIAVIALSASAASAQGSLSVDENLAKRGKDLYKNKGCGGCHVMGKKSAGPDLIGLMERRDHAWVREWLLKTDSMLESDSLAKAMLAEYKGVKMPNMRLSEADVDALLHYIQQETNKKK